MNITVTDSGAWTPLKPPANEYRSLLIQVNAGTENTNSVPIQIRPMGDAGLGIRINQGDSALKLPADAYEIQPETTASVIVRYAWLR